MATKKPKAEKKKTTPRVRIQTPEEIDYTEVASNIFATIRKLGENCPISAYEDAYQIALNCMDTDRQRAHEITMYLRALVTKALKAQYGDPEQFYEIYRKCLLMDAHDYLDEFLLYNEIDRPLEERFYQTRRKVLKPVVDAIQDLADDRLDELFIAMPPRTGKLLADSTPILTTKGWKKHGDLEVGDYVYNPDGKPTKVIRVLPKNHTTHTVTFTDGTQIKCHFRHEWRVYDRRFGKVVTWETQDMIGRLENGGSEAKRGNRYNFMIPNREPICGAPQNLSAKPYSLGVWLGDGTNKAPRITYDGHDSAMIDGMIAEGYEVTASRIDKNGVYSCDMPRLRKDLSVYGMCNYKDRTEKHIPVEYLCSPIEDRLKLLAGLLDSDGCLAKKEKRYHFSTASERMRDDFITLVSTFGWRCAVSEEDAHTSTSGITGRSTCYTISFNPTFEIPCRLERKQLHEFSKQRRIAIKNIEESEQEQGNCITVEGDGMYLAGKTMIPTHNTSLLVFTVAWLMGRKPDVPNLYSSYTGNIVGKFYDAVLEIMSDKHTYRWGDVFPQKEKIKTDALEHTVNLGRPKHYPTLTCRSIDGTLNGACDVDGGFSIGDDFVSGIEEALSKDRMLKLWSKVSNDYMSRGKPATTKYVWMGTRWSQIDPEGMRLDLLENGAVTSNRRFRVINLPALNENDESNFDYPYKKGFSTEAYRMLRENFERNNDMASWLAQYQGQPIEREGALFSAGDFSYYNGVLPDEEPDRVFMAVDPAYGGGDFVAAPICFQYGDVCYVEDVVYNDGDKRITQPDIANKAKRYGVSVIQIEVNKSTEGYKDGLSDALSRIGHRATIRTKNSSSQTAKWQRIFDKAPDIRETFVFRDTGHRTREYTKFMENVFSYKVNLSERGLKKQHDDAPDSLAQAIDMLMKNTQRFQIIQRPF